MTQEEAKILEDKYRWVNTNNLCEVYQLVTPKFKPGDVVRINSGEGPLLTILKHSLNELRGVKLTKAFDGYWTAEYFTDVVVTEPSGRKTEALQPFRIIIQQDLYEKVEEKADVEKL